MSYFYIPKNYTNLSNNFICKEIIQKKENNNQTIFNYEKKIENIIKKNQTIWNIYKDAYFYYKNVFNVLYEEPKSSVTSFNALNKTFYIMWELNNIFNFMDTYKREKQLQTFHFSKCQPGIIQFLNTRRTGFKDYHMGIFCEEWRKNNNYLGNNNNIYFNDFISYNFINDDSLLYLTENYSKSFDIITFLGNEEINELINTMPNLSEKDIIILKVFYSLLLQRKNGTLIFSIPDIFDQTYYELMYIISSCYNKVVITKPVLIENTSKRKIVICNEYSYNYDQHTLIQHTQKIIQFLRNKKSNKITLKLIDNEIPSFFLNKLFEINIIMFQQTIDATLSVINIKNNVSVKELLDKLNRRSLQKSMFWCVKNNFDYNKNIVNNI